MAVQCIALSRLLLYAAFFLSLSLLFADLLIEFSEISIFYVVTNAILVYRVIGVYFYTTLLHVICMLCLFLIFYYLDWDNIHYINANSVFIPFVVQFVLSLHLLCMYSCKQSQKAYMVGIHAFLGLLVVVMFFWVCAFMVQTSIAKSIIEIIYMLLFLIMVLTPQFLTDRQAIKQAATDLYICQQLECYQETEDDEEYDHEYCPKPCRHPCHEETKEDRSKPYYSDNECSCNEEKKTKERRCCSQPKIDLNELCPMSNSDCWGEFLCHKPDIFTANPCCEPVEIQPEVIDKCSAKSKHNLYQKHLPDRLIYPTDYQEPIPKKKNDDCDCEPSSSQRRHKSKKSEAYGQKRADDEISGTNTLRRRKPAKSDTNIRKTREKQDYEQSPDATKRAVSEKVLGKSNKDPDYEDCTCEGTDTESDFECIEDRKRKPPVSERSRRRKDDSDLEEKKSLRGRQCCAQQSTTMEKDCPMSNSDCWADFLCKKPDIFTANPCCEPVEIKPVIPDKCSEKQNRDDRQRKPAEGKRSRRCCRDDNELSSHEEKCKPITSEFMRDSDSGSYPVDRKPKSTDCECCRKPTGDEDEPSSQDKKGKPITRDGASESDNETYLEEPISKPEPSTDKKPKRRYDDAKPRSADKKCKAEEVGTAECDCEHCRERKLRRRARSLVRKKPPDQDPCKRMKSPQPKKKPECCHPPDYPKPPGCPERASDRRRDRSNCEQPRFEKKDCYVIDHDALKEIMLESTAQARRRNRREYDRDDADSERATTSSSRRNSDAVDYQTSSRRNSYGTDSKTTSSRRNSDATGYQSTSSKTIDNADYQTTSAGRNKEAADNQTTFPRVHSELAVPESTQQKNTADDQEAEKRKIDTEESQDLQLSRSNRDDNVSRPRTVDQATDPSSSPTRIYKGKDEKGGKSEKKWYEISSCQKKKSPSRSRSNKDGSETSIPSRRRDEKNKSTAPSVEFSDHKEASKKGD